MEAQDLKRANSALLPRAWSAVMQLSNSRGQLSQSASTGSLLLIVAILVSMTVATLLLQLSTYPNHDVAWVLWGTREMLMGATWGVDVIEPNPPLIWYLSMPGTAVALWLGWPIDWTFRIVVAVAGALSAGCFGWLLREADSKARYAFFCTIAGVCLLLLPGREFGQREHLLTIAILPYLALSSLRIGGENRNTVLVAVAIGIAAGLGIALKPYFLAVPALVEIAVQVLSRRRVSLLRSENFAIGSVIAVYVIYLFAFEQAYLKQVVPLANEIYWSFNLPMAELWPWLASRLLAAIPFAAYAIYRRDPLGVILSAALCGVTVSYLVQHKGYPYHLLPIVIFSFILVAHYAIAAQIVVRAAALFALVALTFVCARPPLSWWMLNRPGSTRAAEIDGIRNSIAAHARNGRFLIVAVHPYPTFPVAIYTPAHHVSRTNSHWFLPAVFQLRGGAQQRADAISIERRAREFILHDLAAQPDLVLIDKDSVRHTVNSDRPDILTFYREDPAFRRVWQQYREIKPVGDYRQFVRVPPESERSSL